MYTYIIMYTIDVSYTHIRIYIYVIIYVYIFLPIYIYYNYIVTWYSRNDQDQHQVIPVPRDLRACSVALQSFVSCSHFPGNDPVAAPAVLAFSRAPLAGRFDNVCYAMDDVPGSASKILAAGMLPWSRNLWKLGDSSWSSSEPHESSPSMDIYVCVCV